MTQHNVCIIGDGAIGSLFAAFASANDVMVYRGMREHKTGVKSVTLFDGKQTSRYAEDISPIGTPLTYDLVVFPLKVYQLEAALLQWQAVIGDSPILLLQNGMGGEEIARKVLPLQRIYQATTSHGALKTDHESVRHTGMGNTLAGRSLSTPADLATDDKIRTIVETAFPPVTWCEDIYLSLWQKLSVNLAINPLTAIHDIRNGQILAPRYTSVLDTLSHEIAEVMQACGLNESAETILARIKTVAQATADNFSSMHQDIAHQRQTEIDAITGYLLSKAASERIAVPTNARLYQPINQLSV